MRKSGRHMTSGARHTVKKRKEKSGGTSMQRSVGHKDVLDTKKDISNI